MVQMHSVRVDPSNAAQLKSWDGDQGAYWALRADYFDTAVAGYDRHLFAAAAIKAAEQVLDIGCGTGQTTLEAARQAAPGSALGVDLSAQMIEVARRTAECEGVANARLPRPMRRFTHFPSRRSMLSSAGPGPCSSVIRWLHLPTSPTRCARTGDWSCSSGNRSPATSTSWRSALRWPPGVNFRLLRPRLLAVLDG